MRVFSKTALIIFVMTMFFYTLPSNALVLDGDYLKAKITEDLNNKYKENNPDGSIVVKNVPVVNVELKGTSLAIDTTCDFSTKGENKLAKVSLMENGRVLRVITVPVMIKSYDTVLVATKDIQKDELLTSANTQFEKRIVKNYGGYVIGENSDITSLTPQKTIKAGEVIDKRFLKKQTIIYRTNPVTAVFQSGGISLSIEVTALESGGIGDYIKVQSKEYNKIYQGKVVNSNQVLIQI